MHDRWRALRLMVSFMFRADRKLTLASVVLTPLTSAASPATALGIKFLIDGAVEGSSGPLVLGVVVLSVAVGFLWWLEWMTYRVMIALAERTSAYGDEQVMKLVGSIPGLEHHERPDYLDTLQLVRTDTDWYQSAVGLLIGGLGQTTLIVATLGLLGAIHPALLVLLLFGVPSLVISLKSQTRFEQVQRETAEPKRFADRLFDLSVGAGPAKEIRIFGLRGELLRRFGSEFQRAEMPMVRHARRQSAWSALGRAIVGVGFIGAIFFVAWRAASGLATPGDIVLALYLAQQVSNQVEGAWAQIRWGRHNLVAAGRFLWLLDYAEEPPVRTPAEPLGVPGRIAGGLAIKDVSFVYPGTEAEVLRDIRLEIPAGATVALVGENGAGKTTLVKLLCRFYEPTGGSIALDGIDIARFDPLEWRGRIATAFQDYSRFEFVARESIGVGDLERVEEPAAAAAALERAGASELSRQLPRGLETQLGRDWEGGVELSVGQWQKVALSRAVMREHPLLLILDEPTASLDAETEYALFQSFHEAALTSREAGSITLLVSHRFSTVRMADLIIVIDSGRMVEMGGHADLMRAGGLYAELFSIQASAYREA